MECLDFHFLHFCIFLFSRRQYKISQTSKEKNKNTGCLYVCMHVSDGGDGWMEGWMGGRKEGLELLLSEELLFFTSHLHELHRSHSLNLSLSLSHHGVLLTRDYSVYSGGRRRDEGREEEEEGEEGGGGVRIGGGAQSSLLSESRAVLILFVWPHTFPAFLSLFTAAVALMILALASSFAPPASLLFFMGLPPVVFSSSW